MQCVCPTHLLFFPAERLSLGYLVSYLRWVIGLYADAHPNGAPYLALFHRLGRLSARFNDLIVRFRAGTLRPARPFASRSTPAALRPPPSPLPALRLPAGFGWLRYAVGWRAAHCQSWLEHHLADAEMQALMQAAPGQARRLLRPFCHLLGVTPPDALRLPLRVRRPRETLPDPAVDVQTLPAPACPSPEIAAALRRFPRLGATRIPLLRKPRGWRLREKIG